MSDFDNGRRVLNYLLQHIVTFAGAFRFKDKTEVEKAFNYSAFVVSVNDLWLLVTAGHILTDLDPHLDSGAVEFTARVLVDYYSPEAKHRVPVPFDYESHKRVKVYEHGLDFALLELTTNERELLAANGVVPFVFDGRPERPWDGYEGFAIVGFPESDLVDNVGKTNGPITLGVVPGLAPVERLDGLPRGCVREKYDSFIGRLMDTDPKDIVGMSGGPIVGFKRNGPNLDYWVVAIQSRWLDQHRIVFGCPVPTMFDAIRRKLGL